ncbi:MAG: hypothetical protein ACF8XB_11545 [Planctomycetota bacterium JB042]
MSRSRFGSRAACAAALLLVSGAAAGQVLQPDDVLLVRYACGGSTKSTVEAYRPSTGLRVLATPRGTQKCWEGVTRLPTGGFAIARKFPAGVNVFDASGLEVHSFDAPEIEAASDVAAFSDGSLAVVDLAAAGVARYSATGLHLGTFSHSSLVSPWGLHVDGADVLWVTDRVVASQPQLGAFARFDASGAWLGTIALPVQCDDLAVAPDGTAWTIGASNGVAYHLQADGTVLSSFPTAIPGDAHGIARLSDGSLVFSSSSLGDLHRYAPDGTLLGKIPISPGTAQAFRLDVVVNAQWLPVGSGIAGVAGVPKLTGSGTLLPGTSVQLQLQHAAPSAATILVLGAQRVDLPLLGGTLVPKPDVLLQPIPTGTNGSWTLGAAWPAGVPSGTKLWMQAWVPDAAAIQGTAASFGLEATAP